MEELFRFERPDYLWLLALPPLLIVWRILVRRMLKRRLRSFVESISSHVVGESNGKFWLSVVLTFLAACLVVVGLANPQAGARLQEVKHVGADVVFCLDISNSMNAEDLQPSRLERAKQLVLRTIDKLQGDRIGLVVFAGEAYVQLPMTTDYSAARLFLQSVNTDFAASQGTSISTALELAEEVFPKRDEQATNAPGRAIIVITDGEDHEADAVAAAETLAGKGIVVHAIGMGSVDGAPIPVYRGSRRVGFRKNSANEVVVTKLNESILRGIAAAGNGVFVRATNSSVADDIVEQVYGLDDAEIGVRQVTEFDSYFPHVLALAALLYILDLAIVRSSSRNRTSSSETAQEGS